MYHWLIERHFYPFNIVDYVLHNEEKHNSGNAKSLISPFLLLPILMEMIIWRNGMNFSFINRIRQRIGYGEQEKNTRKRTALL